MPFKLRVSYAVSSRLYALWVFFSLFKPKQPLKINTGPWRGGIFFWLVVIFERPLVFYEKGVLLLPPCIARKPVFCFRMLGAFFFLVWPPPLLKEIAAGLSLLFS